MTMFPAPVSPAVVPARQGLSPEEVRRVQDLLDRGVSASTRASYSSAWRGFEKWAQSRAVLALPQLRGWRRPLHCAPILSGPLTNRSVPGLVRHDGVIPLVQPVAPETRKPETLLLTPGAPGSGFDSTIGCVMVSYSLQSWQEVIIR